MNILNTLRLLGNKISGAVIDEWPGSEANDYTTNLPPCGALKYEGGYGGMLYFYDGKGWVECGGTGTGPSGEFNSKFGIQKGTGVNGTSFTLPVVPTSETNNYKLKYDYTFSTTTLKITQVDGNDNASSSNYISIPLRIQELINNSIYNISFYKEFEINAHGATEVYRDFEHGLGTQFVEVSVYKWGKSELIGEAWNQIMCEVAVIDDQIVKIAFTSPNPSSISGKYRIVILGAYETLTAHTGSNQMATLDGITGRDSSTRYIDEGE